MDTWKPLPYLWEYNLVMAPVDPKGPFSSIQSSRIIMGHISQEIFPSVKGLRKLSVEVSAYRQGFWNSFYRGELDRLFSKYQKANEAFLSAYNKFEDLDELFKDVLDKDSKDQQMTAYMIGDYMRMLPSIKPHLDEGFRLSEIIDRTLGRHAQSADQRVASVLSIAAITVTILLALIDNAFAKNSTLPEIPQTTQEGLKG